MQTMLKFHNKKTKGMDNKMNEERIGRINELARKSKAEGLTPEEKEEQQK